MRTTSPSLTRLVESVVAPMGYEPLCVEFVPGADGSGILRVYIDHVRGITLADCEAVSRQLSSLLDVEEPVAGRYDLEVSSPGLDRPLVKLAHFERFTGQRAWVRLTTKLAGRRRFAGVLAGIDGTAILMDVDGERFELPFALIESARLVPEF